MSDKESRTRLPIGRLWDLVVLNCVAVGVAFGLAAMWARQLPARYPAHWNARGEVDRWAASGTVEWYLVPIIAAVSALFLVGLAVVMPRIPLSMWNIPRKQAFLSLPRRVQGEVATWIIRWILWLSVLDTALFVGVHYLMYASALGGPLGSAYVAMGVLGGVYLGFIGWGIVAMSRRVRRATREVSQKGAPGTERSSGPPA